MSTAQVADGVTWQAAGPTRSFARNPALQPFTSNSVWNLPIASGATFEASTDVITADLIKTSINAWVNQETYSHSVYQAQYGDPYALATDSSDIGQSGTFRVPTTATPATGSDKHMHVIDPIGRFIHETIGTSKVSNTSFTVSRHASVDLYGNGLGPFNGVRAYGGSAIGGLIRSWEVDSTNANYTGQINHALALALDPTQMYYSSGNNDYNHSTGYGNALGYVWPATEQDGNSTYSYTGNVPMGCYFAIPPAVDITQLGLSTAAGLVIARTLQQYGGYVTDTTTGTFAFYIETYAPTSFRDQLRSNSSHDLKLIRAQLRAVTNNAVGTPNGGALGAARSQALAAALPAQPVYAS